MGVTSSGQIINLAKPPSWLKPNTLIRPLNYISPDRLLSGGPYQICDGSDQCINVWGGVAANALRFYRYVEGENNNEWNWWYEGTVSGSQGWPFTNGSGVNIVFDGNPVYKFAWAPNGNGTGNCIDQGAFHQLYPTSYTYLQTCVSGTSQTTSSSKWQYFVIDGSRHLVAVGATNWWMSYKNNNDLRVWIGVKTSDANGNYVYLETDRTNALTGFRALVS